MLINSNYRNFNLYFGKNEENPVIEKFNIKKHYPIMDELASLGSKYVEKNVINKGDQLFIRVKPEFEALYKTKDGEFEPIASLKLDENKDGSSQAENFFGKIHTELRKRWPERVFNYKQFAGEYSPDYFRLRNLRNGIVTGIQDDKQDRFFSRDYLSHFKLSPKPDGDKTTTIDMEVEHLNGKKYNVTLLLEGGIIRKPDKSDMTEDEYLAANMLSDYIRG